jgi:hypothetical protein
VPTAPVRNGVSNGPSIRASTLWVEVGAYAQLRMHALVTYVNYCPRPSDSEHLRLTGTRGLWIRPICIALSLTSACRAESPEKRVDAASDAGISMLDSLAERIAVAEATLSEKEALAREAEREARFSECRAQVAEATAESSLARAQCLEQLASEAQCMAEVERAKGEGTLAGCGIGILVALFTGGSAAPWALGGCFTGRVLADAQARECAISDCAEHLQERQVALLKAKGWSELPQCGGRLGLEVETPLISVSAGVRVTVPGLLGSAGIRTHDVIVSMKEIVGFDVVVPANEFIPLSQEDYDAMVRGFAGHEVEFGYVRGEQLYVGRAMIPQDPRRGRPDVEPIASVSYRWGAPVIWVAPWIDGGPTIEWARILTLDGQAVTSRDHLRQLLRYRRAGETVTLWIRSEAENESRDVQLTLSERGEPVAL